MKVNDEYKESFGSMLRDLRVKRGLSVNRASELCGVECSNLCKIERGIHIPGIHQLNYIAGLFEEDGDDIRVKYCTIHIRSNCFKTAASAYVFCLRVFLDWTNADIDRLISYPMLDLAHGKKISDTMLNRFNTVFGIDEKTLSILSNKKNDVVYEWFNGVLDLSRINSKYYKDKISDGYRLENDEGDIAWVK